MTVESLLVWLVIGGLAGWIAGVLVRGAGHGILINIVVGIVGAFIGGALLGSLGVFAGSGLLGAFITALIGAIVLLAVLRLIRRV
ncbi:MAG: GlsB/YeaQ/YmgE family stress response membrane protein [Thioalkalivibrionaceae bacterium]